MNKILISFSGGRTSAFMTKYLVDKYNGEKELLVIFANTGKERPETLRFVDECDKRWNLNVHWIEAVINEGKGNGTTYKKVTYETASRNGDPFEDMIKKYGIPNNQFLHCSRELKIIPIHKYATDLFGSKNYHTAIGIRSDEVSRINWERAKKEKLFYPLATEFRVDSDYIRKFWASQDFDLNLKDYQGNCDMCWKISERKLLTIITEKPNLIEWWIDMEINYGKGDHTFFRGNKSGLDLFELAKQSFVKAVDKFEQSQSVPTLFNDMDIEYDCFCKTS